MIRVLPFLLLIGLFLFLWFGGRKMGLADRGYKATRNIFDTEPKWSKHTQILKAIAASEHDVELLPHNDPWVTQVCPACNKGNILFPSGRYGEPPNMSLDGLKEEK